MDAVSEQLLDLHDTASREAYTGEIQHQYRQGDIVMIRKLERCPPVYTGTDILNISRDDVAAQHRQCVSGKYYGTLHYHYREGVLYAVTREETILPVSLSRPRQKN